MFINQKCSICGERVGLEGGWLNSDSFQNWVCIDCDDWVIELDKPEGELKVNCV